MQTNEKCGGDKDAEQEYIGRDEFQGCLREFAESITKNICNVIGRRESRDSASSCSTPESRPFQAEMRAIEKQEMQTKRPSHMFQMGEENYSGPRVYDHHSQEINHPGYMSPRQRQPNRHGEMIHMSAQEGEYGDGVTYDLHSRHNDQPRYETGGRNRGPNIKLPSYEGKLDIDVFFAPFERLATRYQWDDEDKIDRIFQCLQGTAMRYLCGLPRDVVSSYVLLKQHLMHRFGSRDPPATIRRKLGEMRQGANETNEEFAEEINKLVTRAFPDVTMDMIDQLSAENFLRGYKNTKLAYEALNKNPRTLNHALNDITLMEHNFKATLGRDSDRKDRTARKVSWSDMGDMDDGHEEHMKINRIGYENKPTYVTVNQLDARLNRIEEMLLRAHIDQCPYQGRNRSPSPASSIQCFQCREQGHMARDCQKLKDTQNTGIPSTSTPAKNVDVTCFQCGGQGHMARECPNRARSPRPGLPTQQSQTSIKVLHVDCIGSGMMIPLSVNGIETSAVLDTGSDATIISTDVAKKANIVCNDESKRCNLLSAADNAEMPAFGGVTATLCIAGKDWKWPVYVAPIRDKVLLGIDFLRGSDAKILVKPGELVLGDQLVIRNAATGETPVSVAAKGDEVSHPAPVMCYSSPPSDEARFDNNFKASHGNHYIEMVSHTDAADCSLRTTFGIDDPIFTWEIDKHAPHDDDSDTSNECSPGISESSSGFYDGKPTCERGERSSKDNMITDGASSLRTSPQWNNSSGQTGHNENTSDTHIGSSLRTSTSNRGTSCSGPGDWKPTTRGGDSASDDMMPTGCASSLRTPHQWNNSGGQTNYNDYTSVTSIECSLRTSECNRGACSGHPDDTKTTRQEGERSSNDLMSWQCEFAANTTLIHHQELQD